MRRQWPYWFDPIQQLLFEKHTNHYTTHPKLTHDYDITCSGRCQSLPATATPVDVTKFAQTLKVHQHYVQGNLPPSLDPPTEIQTLISTLPSWEKPLHTGLTLQVSIPDLLQHLQSPILVASDGSVNEHRSSFGWVLATREGQQLLSSRGPAPGAKPTSYRAEGIGILSVLRCFLHLQQLYNITISGTLLCDNKSMIERTQAHAELQSQLHPRVQLGCHC